MNGNEVWRPIPGYEGKYEASPAGEVRSLDRIGRPGHRIKGKILRGIPFPTGHLYVTLCSNGLKRRFAVHTLILLTFVGPCPEGMECCHNDGNPANNRLSNLRWDTRTGNMQDRVSHGTLLRGSGKSHAKLTEADIPSIFETRAGGVSQREIADMFGVSRRTIGHILGRKQWTHVEIDPDLLLAVTSLQGNARGERHRRARLTEADVLEVYRMRKEGRLQREIAEAFGVALTTIGSVLAGRSWWHLYHHYLEDYPAFRVTEKE